MTNPERINEKTPNGGDYSEFWYLRGDGSPAKSLDEATHFRIRELTNTGDLVQETYGVLEKQ